MKRFSRYFALLCALVCVAAAENPASAGAVIHLGERLIWPVVGTLIKGFGSQRLYPGPCSFHTGVDFKAPKGRAVVAAASGKVLFEGWLRGYGQVVIIDHDCGYTTVYAHMSSIHVRKGAAVTSGAIIGGVGKTGTSDGYHLHFEVRKGSTPKDPMNYLKRW